VEVVRSVVIDCHVDDVFDYVADPGNDREWRSADSAALTCLHSEPPHRIAWCWEADGDTIEVTFTLEPVWTSTRLTVRQEHRRRRARLLQRARAARDLDRRLAALRRRLERR
jgi:uncharacterized protein YndB with AHSA1/START domain